MHLKFWIENPKEREDLRRYGLDSSASGQVAVAGCCEHFSTLAGRIKGGKFFN
jgi:hypothetical protein